LKSLTSATETIGKGQGDVKFTKYDGLGFGKLWVIKVN